MTVVTAFSSMQGGNVSIPLPDAPLDVFSGVLWGFGGGSVMRKPTINTDSPEYRKQIAEQDYKKYLPRFVKCVREEKGFYTANTADKVYKVTYCHQRIALLFALAESLGWIERILPSDPRFPPRRSPRMKYYKTLRVPTAKEVARASI